MDQAINKNTNTPGVEKASKGKTIILAGATGDLGQRIVHYILQSGAQVKALVRKGSNRQAISHLQKEGALIIEVDYNNPSQLKDACQGGDCFVSALNGLEDVIIDLQRKLLQAAVEAGVPRFIPSDYCIDYTQLPHGSNRNLDWRRKFHQILDGQPIAATSVFNGMFTNLLTGQAPVILFGLKRVVYWGNAEQELDFTSIENSAAFTAKAALDNATPRYLKIAGDVINAKGLAQVAAQSTGKKFGLLKAGSLGSLKNMIKITRTLIPKKDEVFPPWQGMQYLHNMFSGISKLEPLDNHRYGGIHWTTVKEILDKRAN